MFFKRVNNEKGSGRVPLPCIVGSVVFVIDESSVSDMANNLAK